MPWSDPAIKLRLVLDEMDSESDALDISVISSKQLQRSMPHMRSEDKRICVADSVEKVIEKTKQIIVQNNIENKKVNYKFDTTKIEQKNNNSVTNNQLVNLIETQVTKKDLDKMKKDVTSSFREEININKEKTLKESEAISKKIVAEEFSKFLR